MGGSDSLYGDLLAPDDLRDAWVIDLAGDLPPVHRAACALWLPRVFPDIEGVPHAFPRVSALAGSVAACLTGAGAFVILIYFWTGRSSMSTERFERWRFRQPRFGAG